MFNNVKSLCNTRIFPGGQEYASSLIYCEINPDTHLRVFNTYLICIKYACLIQVFDAKHFTRI